jgi:ZIP family zinc transporter
VAGFSTLIGTLLVIYGKHKNNKKIATILGFAVGVMIIVSIFELLPEAYNLLFNSIKGFYFVIALIISIIIGIILTLLLDEMLHHEKKDHKLYHVGILATLAVSIHKFPEGIALFLASYEDIKLGIIMTIAIAIHHIPEGMMISAPIYYDTGSRFKAFKYALYSSLMAPLGALLTFVLFRYFINDLILGCLFGIAIGMFWFVIFRELIPTSWKYNYHKRTIISIIIGIIFMLLCHFGLE